MSTFIQIHTLTSHPASLLNRGEEGFAKTMPFGGATRTRISSQCLKYNWRTYDGPGSIRDIDETTMSVRSRETFYRLIAKPFIAEEHRPEDDHHPAEDEYEPPEETYHPEVVYPVVRKLQLNVTDSTDDFDVDESIEAGRNGDTDHLKLGQVVVFGPPEIAFMRSVVAEQLAEITDRSGDEDDDLVDAIDAVLPDSYETDEIAEGVDAVAPAGLDAAMFGRMVTDEGSKSQVEAAIHVKHALTVHSHQGESDYFIAADKFQESGGGHLNSKSLTSGLYYTNVVVDYDGLVRNLSGRDDIADELIRRLLKIIATVTPGAKKSSTAPYSHAEFVMVERGEKQPRTLANAFRTPVNADDDVSEAQRRLREYLSGLDDMYGAPAERYVDGVDLLDPVPDAFGKQLSLSKIQEQI
jgi:CRISPR system Cascade subunit CasC